jgi:hypothetical protein
VPFSVVAKQNEDALKACFAENSQMLLPLLDLVQNTRTSINELMHDVGRSLIEQLLVLSATRVAGDKHPGRAAGDIRWHGSRQGRIVMDERKLNVKRPRLLRRYRRKFHKMGNVLNALPKSQQARAKADMQSIWMAATRADAYAAFDRFVSIYTAKYPKATETLKKDRESLLALYDFPAEHWQHLRTTNAIESTFASVRHRTTRTRNCVSRSTFLGLAFKLIEEAEKTWRRINGPEKIKLLLDGIAFKDGEPVQDDRPVQQKLAA